MNATEFAHQNTRMDKYDLKGEKRCIILDYLNSSVDVLELKSTLELFDFTVDCLPHEELTQLATRQLLDEASKSNHGQCLVVCILSSGDQSGFICSNGEYFAFDEVFNKFDANSCSSLRGKPKLFIIKNTNVVEQSINGGLSLNKTSDSNKDDFFVYSATCEEFILTLCNVITSKHKTYDLLQIVRLVKEIVNEALGEKCSCNSTLTKVFKFEK